jgi:anti-sigma factor RsiW
MMMDESMMKLLYRSFEDELTSEEQHRLEEALATSLELRRKRARIQRIREALSSSAVRSFEPMFAERIRLSMRLRKSALARRQIFSQSLSRRFRPLAIAAAAIIVILAAVNLWTSGDSSLSAVLGLNDEPTAEYMETPIESMLRESV